MYKKIFAGGILACTLVVGPASVSALSISDLQAQIQTLLARVAALQTQLPIQASATAHTSLATPRICGILNRSLARGASGDDVRSLQEFLSSEGFFQASATGYFGPITANALARWQAREGIDTVGVLGPVSREHLRVRCGNGNEYGFRVVPQAGNAPLTVTAYANVGGFTIYRYAIDFGDGSAREPIACNAPADACIEPGKVAHTYTADGVYTVALYRTDSSTNASTVIAKDDVRVGTPVTSNDNGTLSADPKNGNAPLSVAFTYRPTTDDTAQYYIEFGDGAAQIMDRQQIYCITAPCPSPSVATHTYQNPGTYTAVVTRYIACLYSNPRCMIAVMPLAKATVTVTGQSTGSGAPTISQFSGPVVLAVNESGTWRISASDPDNGPLSYSIVWGDEWARSAMAGGTTSGTESIVQETSFSHAYTQPGLYRVYVTVSDQSGKVAQASASVQVSQSACTQEYAPVCGRPAGCMNTCPAGAYCTLMCRLYDPVTYSNRCQLNNANATFLHEGVCTGSETF